MYQVEMHSVKPIAPYKQIHCRFVPPNKLAPHPPLLVGRPLHSTSTLQSRLTTAACNHLHRRFESTDNLISFSGSDSTGQCDSCKRSDGDPNYSATCGCICPPGGGTCSWKWHGVVQFNVKSWKNSTRKGVDTNLLCTHAPRFPSPRHVHLHRHRVPCNKPPADNVSSRARRRSRLRVRLGTATAGAAAATQATATHAAITITATPVQGQGRRSHCS